MFKMEQRKSTIHYVFKSVKKRIIMFFMVVGFGFVMFYFIVNIFRIINLFVVDRPLRDIVFTTADRNPVAVPVIKRYK